MRRVFGLLALTLVVACKPASATKVALADAPAGSSTRTPSRPLEPAAAIELRFAWPPGGFEVIERVEKRGHVATLRYSLLGSRQGDELWIEYENMRFVDLDGVSADDPALRDRLGPLERQLASQQLGLRIDPQGNYLGLSSLEAAAEVVRALDPEKADYIAQLLANPQLRTMVEQAAGKPWGAWVGAWNGLVVAPGEVIETAVEHQVVGVALTEKVRYEHLGDAAEHPGYVRLRYEGHIDDPRFALVMTELVDTLAPEAGTDRAKIDAVLANLRATRDTQVEAIVEPTTLVPAWVRMHEDLRVELGGESQQRVETYEWTFTRVGG